MNKSSALLLVASTTLILVLAATVYAGSLGALKATATDAAETDQSVMNIVAAPLEDVVLGSVDAGNTIIEYASLTCTHCASFHVNVFPELKAKYIDTGKARFVLRDFPLDAPATAAAMLLRCASKERFYELAEKLLGYQEEWVNENAKTLGALLFNLFQAEGFSQEQFNACLADKGLFEKITESKNRAHDQYEIGATPTFFVNGKRVESVTRLEELEVYLNP